MKTNITRMPKESDYFYPGVGRWSDFIGYNVSNASGDNSRRRRDNLQNKYSTGGLTFPGMGIAYYDKHGLTGFDRLQELEPQFYSRSKSERKKAQVASKRAFDKDDIPVYNILDKPKKGIKWI